MKSEDNDQYHSANVQDHPNCMCFADAVGYIGVGRFRILGGGGKV